MHVNYPLHLIQRIAALSADGQNGCRQWIGTRNAYGYGLVSITHDKHRRLITAHRAQYMAANNCLDLSPAIRIGHVCGNRACVSGEHIVIKSKK